MIFEKLQIDGAYKIFSEFKEDERGSFGRTFCSKEFKDHGLESFFVQESISYNRHQGTFRGMHLQNAPKEEAKLVRCQKGKILDILLDLRPTSPTFLKSQWIELSEHNRISVYIPKGCAHGFLTKSDHSEVFYSISEFYYPELASGVRWNDPRFRISMPMEIKVISPRDLVFPDYV